MTTATETPDGTATPRARYAHLFAAKKGLEDELKDIEGELRHLEEVLLEEFLAEGMERARVDGVTIYIERQLWAKVPEGVARPDVVAALESAGLRDFITYNSLTLSSYIREVARSASGEDHPSAGDALAALVAAKPALAGMVDVEERVTIRGRRTG